MSQTKAIIKDQSKESVFPIIKSKLSGFYTALANCVTSSKSTKSDNRSIKHRTLAVIESKGTPREKNFITTDEANESTMMDKPVGIAIIGALSVIGCCLFSQIIASGAKKSKLRLNKYYMRKQQEKDELIQYISQEQQMRDQAQGQFTLARFSDAGESASGNMLSPANHPVLSKERLSQDQETAKQLRATQDAGGHSRSSSYLKYGEIGVSSKRQGGSNMKGIKEKKERDSSWDSQDKSAEALRESTVKSSRSAGSVKSK